MGRGITPRANRRARRTIVLAVAVNWDGMACACINSAAGFATPSARRNLPAAAWKSAVRSTMQFQLCCAHRQSPMFSAAALLITLVAGAVGAAGECAMYHEALPLLKWEVLQNNARDVKISTVDSTFDVLKNITTPVAVVAAMVRSQPPATAPLWGTGCGVGRGGRVAV